MEARLERGPTGSSGQSDVGRVGRALERRGARGHAACEKERSPQVPPENLLREWTNQR